jgi:hypothetical protein
LIRRIAANAGEARARGTGRLTGRCRNRNGDVVARSTHAATTEAQAPDTAVGGSRGSYEDQTRSRRNRNQLQICQRRAIAFFDLDAQLLPACGVERSRVGLWCPSIA